MTHERDTFSLRAGTLFTHDGDPLTDACVFVSGGRVEFVGPWGARPAEARSDQTPEPTARLVTPALVAFHVAARPEPPADAAREAFRARCAGGEPAEDPARASSQHVDATKRRALAAAVDARTYTYARQGAAALAASTHLGAIPGGALKLSKAATGLDEPIIPTRSILSLTPGRDAEGDLSRALSLLEGDLSAARASLVEVAVGARGFSPVAADAILTAAAVADMPVAVRAGLGRDSDAAGVALRHRVRYVLDLDLPADDALASALAQARVALAITPARALTLRLASPGGLARAVLDAGGAVALSPGGDPTRAMTDDLSLVAALAASLHGLSPDEILAGLTSTPARLLGLEGLGRVRVGELANLTLFACDDLADVPFSPGASHCVGTVSDGRFVYWVDSEEVS
jgi:imidazolonepropionase